MLPPASNGWQLCTSRRQLRLVACASRAAAAARALRKPLICAPWRSPSRPCPLARSTAPRLLAPPTTPRCRFVRAPWRDCVRRHASLPPRPLAPSRRPRGQSLLHQDQDRSRRGGREERASWFAQPSHSVALPCLLATAAVVAVTLHLLQYGAPRPLVRFPH